jgi:protein-arginine kinase activator protein McsA
MTTSLKDNAYHVLGLTGTATTKQILQRSNEIVHRLKIDDEPEYELDLTPNKNFRTEVSVRDALRRLQVPKARLREYFFWFRISDDVDKQAAGFLSQKDFDQAIAVWQAASGEQSTSGFSRSRNLALAFTVSLLHGAEPVGYIEASLSTWAMLLNSPKFWQAFTEDYQKDAQLLSEDAIAEFRLNVANDLSDIYVEIQEARDGADFVYRFQQFFEARGKKIEESILSPVFKAIQTEVEQLEQVDLGAKAVHDIAKARQLKAHIAAIQLELNKLIDAGLYEDSATKLLRDRVTTALRQIALDIHNHHNDLDTAIKLLHLADEIAGTESLKALLKTDIEQIEQNLSYEKENTLAIEIPGTFGGGTVIFKPRYIAYGGQKIYYEDATEIAYHALARSINLVPASQSYSFMVSAPGQTISVTWRTALYIGNSKKRGVWQKIANVASHVIAPQIVQKMVSHIFTDGGRVRIGNIEFTQEGYSQPKIFGGRAYVSWNDPIYIPQFDAGSVNVWKDENGKGVKFAVISMSIPNAVVLPELVQACVNVISDAKR